MGQIPENSHQSSNQYTSRKTSHERYHDTSREAIIQDGRKAAPRTNSRRAHVTKEKISDLESIETLFAKAVRHHRYGELSKAENIYQRILMEEPNHSAAMKKYGVLSYQLSDYLLAEQLFEEAYSMTPYDEQLSINLVMCKIKLGKREEALPVIQAILKNNPDSEAGKELYAQVNVPINIQHPEPAD